MMAAQYQLNLADYKAKLDKCLNSSIDLTFSLLNNEFIIKETSALVTHRVCKIPLVEIPLHESIPVFMSLIVDNVNQLRLNVAAYEKQLEAVTIGKLFLSFSYIFLAYSNLHIY